MDDFDVANGSVTLRVRDYGGDGRPVVLLHGLASNIEIWTDTAQHLVARHRVVAFDQRNHGLSSDAGEFTFDALATDVDAVVAAAGLHEPAVVGHSWGASVAMHHAATRRDVRAVVGVDGGLFSMRERGMSWEDTERLLRPPHLEGPERELLDRMRSQPSPVPWEASEPVFRRSFPTGPDGVMRRRLAVERHMQIVREMWEHALDEVHARVTCPAMLVLAAGLGEAAAAFTAAKREGAARLAERHPAVRIEWLESVHDVPLLHPRELAVLIDDFVGA